MDLQSIAKTILSGGNQFVANAKKDYSQLTDPKYLQSDAYKARINQLADIATNFSGSTASKSPLVEAALTRLVTDVPRRNLLSDMTPHLLDITTNGATTTRGKVYDSIRQALKAAKAIPAGEGSVVMTRAIPKTAVQVLQERIVSLKSGGFNTKNAEKALAKEIEVARRANVSK